MTELQALRFQGNRDCALELCRCEGGVGHSLVAARIEMGAGRIQQARDWINEAKLRAGSKDDRSAVALNAALLEALARLDLSEVIRAAQAPLPPGPLARLWRAKLRLVAATYRELPRVQTAATVRELRSIQRALARAGELYDAHGAALDRAERLPGRWRAAGFRAVEMLGRRDRQPATSAHALLRQAAIVLAAGADPRSLLDRSEAAYREAGHIDGHLRVAAERARWHVQALGAPIKHLSSAAETLWQAGVRNAAISTLIDAGQIAMRRGDRAETTAINDRLRILAETSGLTALAHQGFLNQADRAMRDGFHAQARDLCDVALSEQLPRLLRATALVIRGSAHSFVEAHANAVSDRQAALDIYMELNAEDLASDVICALAGDLAASRRRDDVARADALLADWAARDTRRGEVLAAYQKRLHRATGPVLLYLAAGRQPDAEHFLDAAERFVTEAEASLGPNPDSHSKRPRMLGMRMQVEAQIASARGHLDAMLAALKKARKSCRRLDMPFEAANCDYMLGCVYLNLANEVPPEQKKALAGKSRTSFEAALEYYQESAGMRLQAASTRNKLAKLALNLQHFLDRNTSDLACAEAARLLREAAREIDVLRQAYTAPTNLDTYNAKASFSGPAREVSEDALRLHLSLRPDPAAAWLWTVRSKARALADLVGMQSGLSPEARAAAEQDPNILNLITREAELSRAMAETTPRMRRQISAELDRTLARMSQTPVLVEYVARRRGDAVDARDLEYLATRTDRLFGLVDWVQTGDAMFLVFARPGETPVFERLPVSVTVLQAQLRHLFRDNRARMTLRGGPDQLEEFSSLVRPLEWLAKPDEPLLFCPTTVLGPLPLHALQLGGASVWHRHPVAYSMGLGIMRLTWASESPRGSGAAVFGDPTLDRERARATAAGIAEALGRQAALGREATSDAVIRALQTARIVHYQGHADFHEQEPMEAHLLLAGQKRLTARAIFDLPGVRTTSVTIGACKGARLGARAGDEPLGLIAALLVAGVRSVTAAAWAVAESSAGVLMERYYAELLAGNAPIDALRTAALKLAEEPATSAPYHWAPFRLYGNPWLAPFPEENKNV